MGAVYFSSFPLYPFTPSPFYPTFLTNSALKEESQKKHCESHLPSMGGKRERLCASFVLIARRVILLYYKGGEVSNEKSFPFLKLYIDGDDGLLV